MLKIVKSKFLISCLFIFVSGTITAATQPLFAGRLLTQPREVQYFQLKDTQQQRYGVDQLKGHWTLMYFGFTRCQGKCPVSFTALKGMYSSLKKQKLSNELMPQVVFVSVDPQRDTLSDIKTFTHNYNPSFIGLSGDLNHLLALSNQLDVSFHVVNPGSRDYTIKHTGEISVINPKGQVVAFFSYPQQAQQITKDYQYIVANYNKNPTPKFKEATRIIAPVTQTTLTHTTIDSTHC